MSCIRCYSTPLNLLNLRNQRQNAGKMNKFCWFYSPHKHSNIISQVGVFPLKVENFATSLNLAVVKPANTEVLIQTGALMIFFYLIANFVVPQLLSKSLQLDQDLDENEKSKANTDLADKEKTSSTKKKQGFNSTKPK